MPPSRTSSPAPSASNKERRVRDARVLVRHPKAKTINEGVRLFARLTDPVASYTRILDYALTFYSEHPDETDKELNEKSLHSIHGWALWTKWLSLLERAPSLRFQLLDDDADFDFKDLVAIVRYCAKSAQSDNARAMKLKAPSFLKKFALAEELVADDKRQRGFLNDVTGTLLCPTDQDFTDENVKVRLRNRNFVPKPHDLPFLLYPYTNVHHAGQLIQGPPTFDVEEDDIWKGLAKSPFVMMAFAFMYGGGCECDANGLPLGSGLTGLALLMTDGITPQALAWTITHLRQSLSSESSFRRVAKGLAFKNMEFYEALYSLFTDPEEAHEWKRLKAWWDARMFPQLSRTTAGSGADADAEVSSTVLSRHRARRAAAAAAAAATAGDGADGDESTD